MKAIVKKWGNSLAIRIPSSYAKDIHIHDGSVIDIEKNKSTLTIKPHKALLSEYLNKINKKNLHQEIEPEGPIGNEAW
jgi:antitoxin MazE